MRHLAPRIAPALNAKLGTYGLCVGGLLLVWTSGCADSNRRAESEADGAPSEQEADAGDQSEAVTEADYYVRNGTSAEIELSLPDSTEGTSALLATRVAAGAEVLIYHAVERTGGHAMPSNFLGSFRVSQGTNVLYEGVHDADWKAAEGIALVLTVGCVFDVDALLQRAGVAAASRVQCGSFNASVGGPAKAGGFDCFRQQALEKRVPVEFRLAHGIDGGPVTTYVATGDGAQFAVTLNQDTSGDQQRTSSIERCTSLELAGSGEVDCVGAVPIYSCTEPR